MKLDSNKIILALVAFFGISYFKNNSFGGDRCKAAFTVKGSCTGPFPYYNATAGIKTCYCPKDYGNKWVILRDNFAYPVEVMASLGFTEYEPDVWIETQLYNQLVSAYNARAEQYRDMQFKVWVATTQTAINTAGTVLTTTQNPGQSTGTL